MALTKVDISIMDNVGTTANKLLAYDGSGNLPAVDGSQLTNVATGILSSASDPTISSNPSGGVGTQWTNTTSGEVYICTDATAGENVWTNVGAGSGDVGAWSYPVSTHGYLLGGNQSAPTGLDHIQKWSTVSDANATDVANLTYGRSYGPAGQRSMDYGYLAGGNNPGGIYADIDKFPFASDTNSTDIGNLTIARGGSSGHGSGTYVYTCTGYDGSGGSGYTDRIDKFPTASDAGAADVANAIEAESRGGSHSSTTHGYKSGGTGGSAPWYRNHIHKFTFASDANATDVGDLSAARAGDVGSSSLTHGYKASGEGQADRLDKFSFASDGNSTNIGDGNAGTTGSGSGGCASSLGYGYAASGTSTNAIDKWSHTTDSSAVDIAGTISAKPINPRANGSLVIL